MKSPYNHHSTTASSLKLTHKRRNSQFYIPDTPITPRDSKLSIEKIHPMEFWDKSFLSIPRRGNAGSAYYSKSSRYMQNSHPEITFGDQKAMTALPRNTSTLRRRFIITDPETVKSTSMQESKSTPQEYEVHNSWFANYLSDTKNISKIENSCYLTPIQPKTAWERRKDAS